MINDPKWRTIARVSGQSVGNVVAVYVHMMTCASNATERGRTQGWNDEDVATALDIETEQVAAIRDAMQGRVLDGDYLSGWEKRQPMREDNSSERGKAFREREKQVKAANQTQPNAAERNVTLDKIREEEIKNKVKNTVEQEALDGGEVRKIFEYWQKVMNSPKSVLDAKRIGCIKRALKSYSPAQVCLAIRGCSKTPHNMGKNDRNTKFNGLDLILRDAEHIDKYIAQDAMQASSGKPETIAEANARIMAALLGEGNDSNTIDMEPATAASLAIEDATA